MWRGEKECDFGVLNEPVYSEKEAAELEVDGRDYGYDCDYNIESFTIEF